MKKIKFSFFTIALIAIAISCKKSDNGPSAPAITNGVIVLNQGVFGHNNSTLTYYDFGTSIATTDYYKDVNNFSLGDAGSDLIVYGGKIYIVMNLDVYDIETLRNTFFAFGQLRCRVLMQ